MTKKILATTNAAYGILASPATAEVTTCTLKSTQEELAPIFKVYMHNGFIHSAMLEFTTDYGDTLPYLFSCDANCVMDMSGDDYRYILGVEPDISAPETVTVVTEAKSDDFRTITTLNVENCDKR